ncbi:outer membrane protein OmpA-like peptidoglycan-associated protein [Conexibacter arvalis]|uniref:Outer membrane protein OmpA-like peptidoglycan-associated protein n=2 Tax=Conexibacter arvalis TaxID=912552 RepID=A0A840IL82_9ACTN|nr:outer membrane protein OmpA-like peptidoglycan-associated protein [Conexibacter arvalis]
MAPIAVGDAVVGYEGSACIAVPWAANDALPADRPVTVASDAPPEAIAMRLETSPTHGRLFAFDPAQADGIGAPIPRPTEGEPAAPTDAGVLCYQPNLRFFHGVDTFSYALVDADGDRIGAAAQVDLRVADVPGETVSWQVASAVTAVAGDRSATVAWSGDPSSTYVVTPYRDGMPQASTTIVAERGATFSGLDNGVAYTFSVQDVLGLCVNGSCGPSQSAAPAVATPAAATTVSLAAPRAPIRYGERLAVEVAVAVSSGVLPTATAVAVAVSGPGGMLASTCEAPLGADGEGGCEVDGLHAGAYDLEGRWPSPSAAFGDGLGVLSGVVVQPAPLRVIARDASRAVGAPDPPLDAVVEGFVAGDGLDRLDGSLRCTTPADASSPPGRYPITCAGVSSPDYAIAFEAGTLTVTAPEPGGGGGGADGDSEGDGRDRPDDGGGRAGDRSAGGDPGSGGADGRANGAPGAGGGSADGGEAAGGAGAPGRTAAARLERTFGGRLVVRRGAVRIGCRLRGAPLRRCVVALEGADGAPIGRGRSAAHGGARGVAVTVRLRQAALRRLLADPAGQRARLRIVARARGGARTARMTVPIRLLAARQTLSGPRAAIFEPDTARPTAAGRRWLESLARRAVGVRRVVCAGHVASVAGPRETPFSLALARDRAVAACAILRAAGLTAPATETPRGKRNPRASDRTARGRALNRRATVTLIR